ncbi:response regulator [Kamptonema formosum]|uniref:response regulator n=1 Tax=Kamptonema formosum TaxID=331992 RepID=UPI0003450010|nr:response regulator [Oscillatoria sp. PCC 10802]
MGAATGSETLRLAAQQPDWIVLDIHLPDMNGFEICRQLKADPEKNQYLLYTCQPVLSRVRTEFRGWTEVRTAT